MTATISLRIPLVLLLIALTLPALAQDPCPYKAIGAQEDLKDPVQLLSAFERWDSQLVASYQERPRASDVPQALPKFSWAEQLANRINLFRTGPEVRKQAPETAWLMADQGVKASTAVEIVAQGLADYHFANKVSQDVGQTRFWRIKNSWLSLFHGIGAGDIPFSEVNQFTKGFHDKVNALRAEPGGQFLADEAGIQKAGFDSFAMLMLARIAGKKPPSLESVYALSLLHPITDHALDSGANVGPSMKKLTRLLQGEEVTAETDFEKVVFKLVRQIFHDFPSSQYPELRATLLALQLEQLKSVELQQKSATDEERIHNTLRKGALTALLFGQLSFGKLDHGQTEYFYRAGSMLQLVDDLLDVSSDLADKNQTVWTLAHDRHRGNLDDPMRRLMKSQKELEDLGPELLKDLPNRDAFLNSFNLAFRMFTYASVFDPVVEKGTRRSLGSRLPMPAPHLRQAIYDILGNPDHIPEKTKEAMKLLDRGFLGGRFFADGAAQQSQGKGIDVGGISPVWWWVRATDAIHRSINDRFVAGERVPMWVVPTVFLYAADVMYHFNQVGQGGIGIAGGIGIYHLIQKYPTAGLWSSLGLLTVAHVLAAYPSLLGEYRLMSDDEWRKRKKRRLSGDTEETPPLEESPSLSTP